PGQPGLPPEAGHCHPLCTQDRHRHDAAGLRDLLGHQRRLFGQRQTLLIERGASIFGEQKSSVAQGQARVFVLWTRIDNPSGLFASLDSPATDQQGYPGAPGALDTHFWERFGGAILLSVIQDGLAALVARESNSGSSGGVQVNNTTSTAQQMATEALK